MIVFPSPSTLWSAAHEFFSLNMRLIEPVRRLAFIQAPGDFRYQLEILRRPVDERRAHLFVIDHPKARIVGTDRMQGRAQRRPRHVVQFDYLVHHVVPTAVRRHAIAVEPNESESRRKRISKTAAVCRSSLALYPSRYPRLTPPSVAGRKIAQRVLHILASAAMYTSELCQRMDAAHTGSKDANVTNAAGTDPRNRVFDFV